MTQDPAHHTLASMVARIPSRSNLAPVLLITMLGVSALGGMAQSLPQYGCDPQHTGRSPYNGTGVNETLWSLDQPCIVGAVGSDGTLYATCYNNVTAFNSSSGDLLWTVEMYPSSNGYPEIQTNFVVGIEGTVVVPIVNPSFSGEDDDYSNAGAVYAYNGTTGSVVWSFTPNSPTIFLFVGSNGMLYVVSGVEYSGGNDDYIGVLDAGGSLYALQYS